MYKKFTHFFLHQRNVGIFKKKIIYLTLKPLSVTRWESRIDSIRPLRYDLEKNYDALIEISEDSNKDIKTRHQAACLCSKIKSFKFITSVVIWYDILSQINIVSKMF